MGNGDAYLIGFPICSTTLLQQDQGHSGPTIQLVALSCTTTSDGRLEIVTCWDAVLCGILKKVQVDELNSVGGIPDSPIHAVLLQCGQTLRFPGQDGNFLTETWKAGATILILWYYPKR